MDKDTIDESRKLVAILFADIEGYTAMMESDEAATLQHLENFTASLHTTIPSFRGEIIQFYGDGCLVAFEDAVDAVDAAKTLQEIFQQKFQLPIRIGIHQGTVIFKEGNMYGEAVNLTSRIEAICMAGGVLFSKTVNDVLLQKPTYLTQSLGSFQFKNIKDSVEVFGLRIPGFPLPERNDILRNAKVIAKSTPISNWKILLFLSFIFGLAILALNNYWEKKSNLINPDTIKTIAVLPFKEGRNPAKNNFYSDGAMETIINSLSRVEALQVTSRPSAERYRNSGLSLPEIGEQLKVNYILDGIVEQKGKQMEIRIDLILLPEETKVWSGRFDKPITLDNILNIQNEITINVIQQLKVPLSAELREQIQNVPTQNFQAYEAYLKGKESLVQYYRDKDLRLLNEAEDFYKKVIRIDKNFAEGYSELANVFWLRKKEEDYFKRNFLDSALILADQALLINPYLSTPYQIRGDYYFEQSRFGLAEQNFRRVLELLPNNLSAKRSLAFLTYFINGNYVEGLDLLLQIPAIGQNNLLDEDYERIAMLYLDIGDFESSEMFFKKSIEQNPSSPGLAWAYHAQGKLIEFKDFMENYLDAYPDRKDQRHNLALAYLFLNDYKKSAAIFEPFIEELDVKGKAHYMNRVRNRYGYLLWKTGKKSAGIEQIKLSNEYFLSSINLGRISSSGGVAQYDLAANFAFLGEKEKAYKYLEAFDKYDWKWGAIHFIQIDPLFDNLRSEDRFKKIINNALSKKKQLRKEVEQWQEETASL